MLTSKALTFFAILIFPLTALRADGLRFNGNRIADKTTSVLKLTPIQIEQLKSNGSFASGTTFKQIQLIDSQRKILHDAVGFSPETVVILPLKTAKNTCTCELLNVGVLFEPTQIEIPHSLLGSSFEERGKYGSRPLSSKPD